MVSFRAPDPAFKNAIDEMADDFGISSAELMRRAARSYLAAHNSKPAPKMKTLDRISVAIIAISVIYFAGRTLLG